MVNTRLPDSITLEDVVAARERLAGVIPRTPMIRLETDAGGELLLKLECLQPVRSFKVRGAYNALSLLADAELAHGVYTASAGNMAQGLAWSARRRGVRCSVVVPDNAPATKLDGIRRLGAEIVKVPYDDWWDVFATHRFAPLEPARFVHPVSDVGMMAGNGTIGLEILEDAPDVDAVLVPFGGGGLSCGIAAAIKASRPDVSVFGCEVDTAAPLAASMAAGRPVEVERTPTFVDGIGGKAVLEEMWPPVKRLLAGALVVAALRGRGRDQAPGLALRDRCRGRRRSVGRGRPQARRINGTDCVRRLRRQPRPERAGANPGRRAGLVRRRPPR